MSDPIVAPPEHSNTNGATTSSHNDDNNAVRGTDNDSSSATPVNTGSTPDNVVASSGYNINNAGSTPGNFVASTGYNDSQALNGRFNSLNYARQNSNNYPNNPHNTGPKKRFIPNPFSDESSSNSENFAQPASHFNGMSNINNLSQSNSVFDFNGMNNIRNIPQTDNSSHFHSVNDISNMMQTNNTSMNQAPIDYYGEAYNNIARERNYQNEFPQAAGEDGQAPRTPSPTSHHGEPQYYDREFCNQGGSRMELDGRRQGNYRWDNDSFQPQNPYMSSRGSFDGPQGDFASPDEDYDDEEFKLNNGTAARGTPVNYEEDFEYDDEENEDDDCFDNDESPSNSMSISENASRSKNLASQYYRITKQAGAEPVGPHRTRSPLISSDGCNRYSPVENLNDIDSMTHPIVIQGRNGTTRAPAKPDGRAYTQPSGPVLETPENYFNNPGRNLEQSRYSGGNIPWGMNSTPKTVPQKSVTDAALLKRNLRRGSGEKVCKRSYGANDPENIAIVNMKENDHLSFTEIVEKLNEKRILAGKNPGLSVCGVTSRYNRTAPLLFAAQGKSFVPLSERRKGGSNHGEWIQRPKWTDELDLELVRVTKEVDDRRWFMVAKKMSESTGRDFDARTCALRHKIL